MRACMYVWFVVGGGRSLRQLLLQGPSRACVYIWTLNDEKNSTHRENKSAIQMICAAVHLAAANRLKHLFVF